MAWLPGAILTNLGIVNMVGLWVSLSSLKQVVTHAIINILIKVARMARIQREEAH